MKKIFLVRGDAPPDSLEGVKEVAIHRVLRLGKSFAYSVNTRFTRRGRKWLGESYTSADLPYPEEKDLPYTPEEMLEEIRYALKGYGCNTQVTLYCEDRDGED